jgi:O-antigen polysaccharide polymerase Wzy
MPYNPLHLFIILAIQIFAIFSLVLLKTTTYFQPETLIYPGCCGLLILSIWFFGSWFWLTRRLFDPYTIFLVSAILFNAGQALLEVFHLNRLGLLRGSFSATTLSDTIFFVALGLCAFHLGSLLSLLACNGFASISRPNQRLQRAKERTQRGLAQSSDITESTRWNPLRRRGSSPKILDVSPGMVWVGWGLASISILPSIYVFLQSLQVVLTQGYQGLYQGDQDTSVAAAPSVIGGFLMPAAVFLFTGSTTKDSPVYRKWIRNIAIGLMIFYVVSQLLLGQRRKVGSAIAALVWLWHEWIAKLPTLLVLGAAVVLALLFPLVAASRNSAVQPGAPLENFLNADSNPLINTLSEMGGTMMTTAHTIDLVPSARPFQMGADYGYALLTLFPNLFWKLHPTIERGLAGHWLVWAVDPEFANRGGGYGYSFIAEAYLNFGWLGGPIALGIIGFLYAFFVLWAINSRLPARIALLATFSVFFPFYARSEASLHVRTLVWYALAPYWGSIGISKWLERQKQKFGSKRRARSSWLR